jgi:hypothetical protein
MLAIIQLLFLNANLFPQDTTSPKYFPLAMGNKWIYNHYWYWSGITKILVDVRDTLVANGHKYFYIRSQTPPPGAGYTYFYVRIDSLSGNIRYYTTTGGACPWLINETTGDSLSAAQADTFYTYCNSSWKLISDSIINIFGQHRSIKNFRDNPPPPNWSKYGRSYVYGIGKTLDGFWYQPGITNWMELRGCVINGIVYGDTNLIGIVKISSEVPVKFSLSQNYPNPFNPTTSIRFAIPPLEGVRGRDVKIIIYDILGREIQTLVNAKLSPGTYEVEFDGTNFASGVYYYTLMVRQGGSSTGDYFETKRMVLIK